MSLKFISGYGQLSFQGHMEFVFVLLFERLAA